MKNLLLLISSLLIIGCATKLPPDSKVVYETENLKILKYSDHVYQHISYLETKSFGKVACNGVVFTDHNESVVIDTPVDDTSSLELIHWIETTLGAEIKTVIPTHFHKDCLGGLHAFHENGITSYSLDKTLNLAKTNGVEVLPQNTFQHSKVFNFGKKAIVVSFLGEGHTQDNVVAYFTDERVLFGGCLVKEINAGKGNLEDANIAAWPKTIKNLKKHYGRSILVIPGHGKAGGAELLDYTLELFK